MGAWRGWKGRAREVLAKWAGVACQYREPARCLLGHRAARYSGGANPMPTMPSFVVLLRGINVGGNNPLPMKDFARLLQALGAQDVQTYIQSGNAVFRMGGVPSDKLAAQIASAIQQACAFEPMVLVMPLEQLERRLVDA